MAIQEKNYKIMHFGKRFKNWRQSQGISAYRLAKLTGVQPSFISNIEANRRPMPEAFMKKLAAIPELNIAYETLRAWKAQAEYNAQELQEAFTNIVSEQNLSSFSCQEVISLGKLYRIPLKMIVNAETLAEPGDLTEPKYYIDFCSPQSLSTDIFCLEIKEDTMWPPVPEGAFLMVKEAESFQDGAKYVIGVENRQPAYQLVQYHQANNQLVPLNPNYPSMHRDDVKLGRIFQVLAYKVIWY